MQAPRPGKSNDIVGRRKRGVDANWFVADRHEPEDLPLLGDPQP